MQPDTRPKHTTMMSPIEFQAKLKRRATRFLFQGDVERYLNVLQELYHLRTAKGIPAA